ncbi:MAG: hypothetical protein IGS39_02635 [Calothrix sp. C42_A2020_038]|nr:hypothetical protein [Calothrix sp. C42_A2020_038]
MNNNSVTFVCCVESGWLEAQTIRMIESLRRWGGCFASSPVYAITPRYSPAIANSTRQIFDKFEVEYIYSRNQNQYSWNKFLNKLLALNTVEQVAKTECIAWLDSDLLIVDEPSLFQIENDKSFRACPSDRLNISTAGVSDPNEPYWREICKCLNLDIEALPWVKSEPEQLLIRFYFNSGVFIYRRSTKFAQYYMQTFTQLCDCHIASRDSGFFFNDQVALGLTVAKMGIPWQTLPYSHNFAIGSCVPVSWYNQEHLQTAKVIHYHDSMWYWFWDTFLESIRPTFPDVAEWLVSIGPIKNQAPIPSRVVKKMLDIVRKRQELAYSKKCQIF